MKQTLFPTLEESLEIDSLALLPTIHWDAGLSAQWKISEQAVHKQLKHFITDKIDNYKSGRDFPAKDAISKLSPYLHFGQLSPNQAWHAARNAGLSDGIKTFCSELGWRSFNLTFPSHWQQQKS